MNGLINYFIKYPVAVNVLMLVILLFGFLAMTNVTSTMFPEVKSRIIQVQVVFPGASPEEVEEGVVLKIEDNLKGVTGIERVSSVSQENAGAITVEVLKGYDTDLILQDVKNAVDQIPSFPDNMEPPRVFKQENLRVAVSYAIHGEGVGLRTLKQKARGVEKDLRNIEGISKVELLGFPEEEVEIAFQEDALRAYDLTFAQAAAAIASANLDITGGKVKAENEELLVRATAKEKNADGLKEIVLKATPDGRTVRLVDVATVCDVWAEDPTRSYLDGKVSAVVNVQATVDEDILSVNEKAMRYFDEFNNRNDVIQAEMIRDGILALKQRIDLLVKNGLIGFLLVLIILSFFLNIRLAFWVALSIPIAFAGMFVLMLYFGVTINVMSLFGMILVVGILVDDGIVIGESIYQEYEKGLPPMQAAIEGTHAVLPAVVSAVLTTVVAFSTFFFLDGRLGDFAPALAFVAGATLLFSLVEGAFILPSHVAHSLKETATENWMEKRTNGLMRYLREKVYAPILSFSLGNQFFMIAVPIFLLALTIGALGGGIIKSTFFPPIERDEINVTLEMASGTREHITEGVLDRVEAAAWQVNEEIRATREDSLDVVLKVERVIGPGTHQGSLNIILLDAETRNIRSPQITSPIREKVGEVNGAQKLIYGITSPFGKPISVALIGNDLNELTAAKEELKDQISALSAVRDVTDTDRKGLREINLRLKQKAHALGLTLGEVMQQVRQGFFGYEVQRLQRGEDEVKVWVKYDEVDRSSLHDLEDMRIRTASGESYPLREVATYQLERGILAVNHLDGEREVRVEAEMASFDESVSDIEANIQDSILPAVLSRYPSIRYSIEGQSRESAKTQKSGKKVLPVVLILMFTIVTLVFRSFPQAVVIFLVVPFGLIGVGWGHWIHGAQVSLLSMFGIIALIGVMVNDSLVLVTAFNRNMKDGMDFNMALHNAAISRFRPIILTSVTTIAGLAPLIFLEKSFQAQFLIPMAIAVAYGLFIATFTTLVLVPLLLKSLNWSRVHWRWLWTGSKPNSEEVEPAVIELKNERSDHV